MKDSLPMIHCGVDNHLAHYLKRGTNYSFSLTQTTLEKIPHQESIKALSVDHHSLVTKEVLFSLPKLQLLVARSVGIDHIDQDECRKRGIALYHIPDYGAYNIAEHALALLLSGCRGIPFFNSQTHAGSFAFESFLGLGLRGKTIGVVGTGKIGVSFIKLLQGFDVQVIAYDVFKNEQAAKDLEFTYVSFDELLKKSDAISIHVPLIPQTKHLFNQDAFEKMKDGVVLVNTARGAVIDTQALIKNHKKCKAICLDVLENEESFSQKEPLLQLTNIIITPHSAFYTDDALLNIARETQNCVQKFLKGDKTGRVV